MSKVMHFFNKKLIFLVLFGGIFSPVSAHIHRIEHWSNNSQSLYLVHDYHVSSNPNNKICDQQQLELLETAKQYNAFVITEDMSVYNNKAFFTDPYNYDPNVPAVHKHRKKHPVTRPPIVGLTVRCQDQKIPVHNVEFRQASVASRHGEERIPARLTLAISNKVRDEIKNYNDGPILNNYYQEEVALYDRNISKARPIFEPIKKAIEPLKKVVSLLQWCSGADEIVKASTHFDDSSVAIWGKNSRLDLATDLYDMRLLNARAFHIAHQHKNEPCIFICLGSEHHRQMKPTLPLIGYECRGIIGESYITQDGTATEPDAINVSEAFETLPKPIAPVKPEQDANDTWVLLIIALAICIVFMLFDHRKSNKSVKITAGMLLFFASMLTQSSLYGYIYCVDVLENPRYKTKIVLLSDAHVDGKQSRKHKNDIVSWVKQTQIKIGIEDRVYGINKALGQQQSPCSDNSTLGNLVYTIGTHLATNLDERILPFELEPECLDRPTAELSLKKCRESINSIRRASYRTPINTYKEKILRELEVSINSKWEKLLITIQNNPNSVEQELKNIKCTKKEVSLYHEILPDATACNFINNALQQKAPVICLVMGGRHILSLANILTEDMNFTKKTIAGWEGCQNSQTNKWMIRGPVQNLYQTLKVIYWPSFFTQHEDNITLVSSTLLGLYIGNRYGSNQSISTQLGLTIGTFFGSIAGYNLIKSGWCYITRRYNCKKHKYQNEIELS